MISKLKFCGATWFIWHTESMEVFWIKYFSGYNRYILDQVSAKLLSRSVMPDKILNPKLWFHGTNRNWLINKRKFSVDFVNSLFTNQKNIILITVNNDIPEIINEFSYFLKLQRTFAWIIRFINNTESCEWSFWLSGILKFVNTFRSATYICFQFFNSP